MNNDAPIGALICGLAIALAVWTLVGAIITRAAVAMFNKLAGSKSTLPDGAEPSEGQAMYNKLAGIKDPSAVVPEPPMGLALGIAFIFAFTNLVASFIIGIFVGAAMQGARGAPLVAQLLSLPVSLLVLTGVFAAMLPTTFERAFYVSLCYLAIAIAIVIVIVAAMFGVAVLVSLAG